MTGHFVVAEHGAEIARFPLTVAGYREACAVEGGALYAVAAEGCGAGCEGPCTHLVHEFRREHAAEL